MRSSIEGAAPTGGPSFAEVDVADVSRALRSDGVWIDIGAASVRVQSDSLDFSEQLRIAYGEFPMVARAGWADLHVQIRRPRGARRWLRPQVLFRCDGRQPFEPFPSDAPLPLFEWGCNWFIGRRMNDLLLLHAGVVERDGLALLMPGLPGSGKSTLTAALSLRGWRLFSDEFGALDPKSGMLHPLLKPVALKNRSIDVLRAFEPNSVLGPTFPNTRKGAVAHLAPQRDAVVRCREGALPGAVVMPRWEAGSRTRWDPLGQDMLFPALAFNAFNYTLLGAVGFKCIVRLARDCLAWQLTYGDLDDALRSIEGHWTQVVERHHRRQH